MFRSYFQSSDTPTNDTDGSGAGSTFDTAVLALSGLRFYYRLADGSGTTMADSGPNALDGTYANAPTLTAAGPTTDAAYGATFNGTDEYGYVSHNAAFDFGTADYSVGIFMLDASWPGASSWLMGHEGDGTGNEWELYQRATLTGLQSRVAGVTTNSGTGLDDGNWHLVGYTADRSGNAQMYVDGSASGSPADISAASATAIDFTGTLYIARRKSTGYASVSLARAFGCASALSAGDWSTLYAAR